MLQSLAAMALVVVDYFPSGEVRGARMHPGVRAAGVRLVTPAFQTAVDKAMVRVWDSVATKARREDGESSGQLIAGARSQLPYLERLGDWERMEHLIHDVAVRDSSRATLKALIPVAGRLVQAAAGTERQLHARRLLAQLEFWLDRKKGANDFSQLQEEATAAGQDELAYVLGTDLVNAYRAAGQLDDALATAERKVELGRRAGYGPWTRLADERDRLRIIGLRGEHDQALVGADELLWQAETLPQQAEAGEMNTPWHVREQLLNTAGLAAAGLEQWDLALSYQQRIAESQRARGASAHDQAITQLMQVQPLIGLDRIGEAEAALRQCREVFEAQRDFVMAGHALSMVNDIERKRGQHEVILANQRSVLRLAYRAGDPLNIAGSHGSYARELEAGPGDPVLEIIAHWLADLTIRGLIGNGELTGPLLRVGALEGQVDRPASLGELCAITDAISGVHLATLLARLDPDPEALEARYQTLLHVPSMQTARTLEAQRRAGPPLRERSPGLPPRPLPSETRAPEWVEHIASLIAPGTRLAGIALHGMPGAGKTMGALEVAYAHRAAYPSVEWLSVPAQGADDCLTRLAAAQPGSLVVVDGVDDLRAADGTLPDAWTRAIRTAQVNFIITSRLPVSGTGLRVESVGPADGGGGTGEEISEWTQAVVAGLSAEARIFFRFLAALEPADRSGRYFTRIVRINWPYVWRRSGTGGPEPEPEGFLEPIALSALGTLIGDQNGVLGISIHPKVAEAAVDPDFQAVVDEEMASFWPSYAEAARRERGGAEATDAALSAARSVLPYLERLARWGKLGESIQLIATRDPSPGSAEAVLPVTRRLVAATTGSPGELASRQALIRVVHPLSPAAALVHSRQLLADAATAERWALAGAAAEDVIRGARHYHRLDEALRAAEQMGEYSRLAGYGPWTRLSDQRARLEILDDQGKHEEVLAQVSELIKHAETLPDDSADEDEAVEPGPVRESLLDTAAGAAAALQRWDAAIGFLRRELAMKEERAAPAHDRAITALNLAGLLARTSGTAEARALAADCFQVFLRAGDMNRAMAADRILKQIPDPGSGSKEGELLLP